jgi:hypothetical protein
MSLTRVDSCDVTCPNCCRPFVVSVSIDGPWPDSPESLGSSIPPGSDSALREGDSYRLDWLEHVGSGSFGRTLSGWQCAGGRGPTLRAAIDDSIDDVIPPKPTSLDEPPSTTRPGLDLALRELERARNLRIAETRLNAEDQPQTAVPPGSDSALRERIGVYDYPSLVSCLRDNYRTLFPDAPLTDPQDMIQRITAEIQGLRRRL